MTILLKLTNFLGIITLETSLMSIKGVSNEIFYVKSTSIRDTFSIQNVCINSTFFESIFAENTYARSASTVKYLEIDLQSF